MPLPLSKGLIVISLLFDSVLMAMNSARVMFALVLWIGICIGGGSSAHRNIFMLEWISL